MNYLFLIMGREFDYHTHNAHFKNQYTNVTVCGVDGVESACDLVRSLGEPPDLIELCGAFDDRMTRRVIEAAGGDVPVGRVTHFASEKEKFERLFGREEQPPAIRPYTPEDEQRVMDIWLSANLEAHDFIPRSYWQENYSAVQQVYLPGSRTFVYEREGEIAGFVSMLEGGFVGALFIDHAHRGVGIGTELIEYCKQLSPSLAVTVYTENKRAVAFYRRCGFAITAEQQADSKGHTEYLMSWKQDAPPGRKEG